MEVVSRSRWLARLVAVAAALTGGTVLLGWATGRTELTTVGSDISMKANTAACFVVLGAALWRRASPGAAARDAIATALAAAAAVVGGLTLLEHLTGLDLGIDQLLFSEPPGMPGTASPGRMGPPASTSFLLLGVALAVIDTPHRAARAMVQALALATAFLALLSLVGYGYGSTALYTAPRLTGIALPTAILLEAVALAVLAVTPGAGLVSALRGTGGAGQLARRTLVYSTVIPLVAGRAIALGLQRGLYDGTFAIAFLVLSLILSLTLLTWRDAVHLARVEAQREAARREGERHRSALREALVRLEESEGKARARAAELEAVLDAVPAAVFITHDREARRMEGNRLAEELLRLPRQANVSSSAPRTEAPRGFRLTREGREIPAQDLPVQVAATRGIEVRNHDVDVVYDDGTVRHLLGNASPLRGAGGTAYGAVGAFVDITERVRAEAELRAQDRRKDEFLAVLAHELRNPLAPIRNSLFLLGRAELGTEQARAKLAVIERQVRHLSRLVDDLLDVSRISRGKVQLQRSTLDLAELIRRTAEDHRDAVVAAGLDLTVEVPDEPLWIEGDATRLAQVAGNLLGNAVKFTHPGGEVTVSLAREGDRGAALRVRDTGVGMDGAMLARLFEPFAQSDQALDRTRGGLGLGLTLVRAFAELHGGSVEARSDGPGRGAELLVRLPLTGAPRRAEPAAAARPAPPPLRILVIEDNADAAVTLRDALADAGHEVAIARDGEGGVAAARRSRPDVVLCDVGLPGLDGYGVARALRADGGARPTLIALTGYASPDDRRRAVAAGFDHHLAKPADLPSLLELLARLPARSCEVLREG